MVLSSVSAGCPTPRRWEPLVGPSGDTCPIDPWRVSCGVSSVRIQGLCETDYTPWDRLGDECNMALSWGWARAGHSRFVGGSWVVTVGAEGGGVAAGRLQGQKWV